MLLLGFLILLPMFPVFAVLIVSGTLLGITQHLIRFIQFLELPVCLLVIGIQVGVQLTRQLAVSLLDIFGRSIPVYPSIL